MLVANWVDIMILGTIAWNIAYGVRRGLLGSAVDFAVFLLSISVALAWNGVAAEWATRELRLQSALAQPITFVLIWIVAALLLGAAGQFFTAPFQWLLWGSTIDLLLSTVPSAARGVAVAGFGLVLVLAPPIALAALAPGPAAELQQTARRSALAPKVSEATHAYAKWVGSLIAAPQIMSLPPSVNDSAVGSVGGTGAAAIAKTLPNGGVTSPQRSASDTNVLPPRSIPPKTGQGFPREVYSALDLLDRVGDSWVRDTLNRWVTSIRFVPSGDAAGHIAGTGYFGVMRPTQYLDGVYYSEIYIAQGQAQRGPLLAGWLVHEAAHVLQANTDVEAYKNCTVRESQAYLLQGYVLLDLFGNDVEALQNVPGIYPHEVRYARAAIRHDIDAMVRYTREIGEC